MTSDLLTIATAVVSALGTVAATAVALAVYRRQLFELARSLHQDLTTGEVAAARDTLGRIAHGTSTLSGARSNSVEVQETLRAWFTLLWCFERIAAGRRSIGGTPLVGRGARRFLDDLVTTQIRFLNEEAVRTRGALTAALGRMPADRESRAAFATLVADLVTDGRREGALAQWDVDEPPPRHEERPHQPLA